jgi:catalase
VLQVARLPGVTLAASDGVTSDRGVVTARATDGFARQFADALAEYRHWERQDKDQVPA